MKQTNCSDIRNINQIVRYNVLRVSVVKHTFYKSIREQGVYPTYVQNGFPSNKISTMILESKRPHSSDLPVQIGKYLCEVALKFLKLFNIFGTHFEKDGKSKALLILTRNFTFEVIMMESLM